MRCLTHAIRLWRQRGGYLCIRRCRTIPFLPHFLWAKSLKECEHMTTDDAGRAWWKEAWYMLTGKHYALKKSD